MGKDKFGSQDPQQEAQRKLPETPAPRGPNASDLWNHLHPQVQIHTHNYN